MTDITKFHDEKTDPRVRVRLETSEGEIVASHLKMMNFPAHPEVVFWGIRVFKKFGQEISARESLVIVYREVFAVSLMEDPIEKT